MLLQGEKSAALSIGKNVLVGREDVLAVCWLFAVGCLLAVCCWMFVGCCWMFVDCLLLGVCWLLLDVCWLFVTC
jgi:hypothetical protein